MRSMKAAPLLTCLLLACGDAAVGGDAGGAESGGGGVGGQDGAPVGAGDATANPAGGCKTNADCPGGWWCSGAAGCDAVWACVEQTPCSAAPPFVACTCAGAWRQLAAGCPEERYAYRDDRSWQPLQSGACDPAAPFVHHHVTLQGEGFGAWVGQRILAQAWDPTGTQVGSTSVELTEASFAHSWSDVVHVDGAGVDITVQIDTDANHNCTPGEPSWTLHVPNPDDYTQPVLTVTVNPSAESPAVCK